MWDYIVAALSGGAFAVLLLAVFLTTYFNKKG